MSTFYYFLKSFLPNSLPPYICSQFVKYNSKNGQLSELQNTFFLRELGYGVLKGINCFWHICCQKKMCSFLKSLSGSAYPLVFGPTERASNSSLLLDLPCDVKVRLIHRANERARSSPTKKNIIFLLHLKCFLFYGSSYREFHFQRCSRSKCWGRVKIKLSFSRTIR